ncbi:MAG TPA: HIT family protein [Anaeromyxobacteraceae bacterium]|nr:HIT family protein [Anaeromyxobacteraceae bacterium]
MSDCIFCRIAAGAAKAEIVHETPDAVAFLDAHPAARGHAMVIPRVHAASLLDLDGPAVAGLFQAVKEVMGKVVAALRPAGMNVGWNHGRAAGQHVFHLHVHVLPRYAEGGRGVQLLGEGGDRGDLAEVAAALRRA